MRVALAALPLAPNPPYIDTTKSTLTSLYVYWDALTGGDIAVLGYKLWMSDKGSG